MQFINSQFNLNRTTNTIIDFHIEPAIQLSVDLIVKVVNAIPFSEYLCPLLTSKPPKEEKTYS